MMGSARVGPGLLLVSLLTGAGCAGARVIHCGLAPGEVRAVNRELRDADARVVYADGYTSTWRRPEVTADSLRGTDAATGEERIAPIAALRLISVHSAAAGGRAGAKWGFLAGAAAGLAWGIGSWDRDHLVGPWSTENSGPDRPTTGRRLLRTAGAAALLGGAGGLVSIPVGMLVGAEVRFVVRAGG